MVSCIFDSDNYDDDVNDDDDFVGSCDVDNDDGVTY